MIIKKSKLRGTVNISGSKNSALPIIAAAMLTKKARLENVPDISDIKKMLKILEDLGCEYDYHDNVLDLAPVLINKPIMQSEVGMFRASYYLMGVYLALFKEVEIAYPGGCSLGSRPIDFHLMGFKELGCSVEEKEDRIIIKGNDLRAGKIVFPKKTLGGTINVALLASRIPGTTVIENISIEPEVIDFLKFLRKMGVGVKRSKHKLWIEGVKQGEGEVHHRIIPDRIVAGTFIALGLINGPLVIRGANPAHLNNFIHPLIQAGANINIDSDCIMVHPSRLQKMDIIVEDYPGFSTDLQPLLLPLLSMAEGESTIKETIYTNRFKVATELCKMGASIDVADNKAVIKGNKKIRGKSVNATDLRAGAALLLASSVAKGKTIINGAEYIERGYGDIYTILKQLGMKFKIIEDVIE